MSSAICDDCGGLCYVVKKIDGLYTIAIELEKKIDKINETCVRVENKLNEVLMQFVERELLRDDAENNHWDYEGASHFGLARQ